MAKVEKAEQRPAPLSGKVVRRILLFFIVALVCSSTLVYLASGKLDLLEAVDHQPFADNDYSGLPLEYALSISAGYYLKAEDPNVNAVAVEREFGTRLAPHHFNTLIDVLRFLEVTGQYDLQKMVLAKLLAPHGVLAQCEIECWSGIANISQDNGFNLSLFFDAYYFDRAKTLKDKGLIWDAYGRIRRLRELTYGIDTPAIGNGTLGPKVSEKYSGYLLASIFLRDQADWRDGLFVDRVLASLDPYGPEPEDGVGKSAHDLFLLMKGRAQLAAGCPVDALAYFKTADEKGSTREIRELARFFMVRAAFSAHGSAKSPPIWPGLDASPVHCASPRRPIPVDWAAADRIILTPGLRTDVAEMKKAMAQ